jgi:hypothetical protein
MLRTRDRTGKRKEMSPATLVEHRRAAGERRSKAREDPRHVAGRRGSPPARRRRIIEVSSEEEDAAEDVPEQSWR